VVPRLLLAALVGASFLLGAPAVAAPTETETETQANRHFHTGVKLYQDGNYTGALAEFEAAYAIKPSARSLQNVALCLKALFRYAEAADKLGLLLDRHAAEIEVDERQAVRDASQELAGLVGMVTIEVVPPTARVTLDGQTVTSPEPIRLDVGEHQIVAEAPGYARLSRVLRVAGGQRGTERVVLEPTAGFVLVEVGDPDAAIAIDGKAVAFDRYRGVIEPGRHLVQIYKTGHEPVQRRIEVAVGQTVEVRAKVGPLEEETLDEEDAAPVPPGQPKPTPPQRGWYALGALTLYNLGDLPEGLKLQAEDDRAGGASGGVRAGYRVLIPLAAEALLDGGRHEVDACLEATATCNAVRYTVDSLRVGGNLRLMSGGEQLRFTSIVGSGAVHRTLQVEGSGSAYGLDPYFLLEIGAQLNLGHVLIELDFVASFEGTAGTTGNLLGGDSGEVYRRSGGGLRLFGIGLRGGWSEWTPSRSAKLLQPAGTR
jgi:tetratricopeptide (TPR) repeat protein